MDYIRRGIIDGKRGKIGGEGGREQFWAGAKLQETAINF
jgi:hypothetical protein